MAALGALQRVSRSCTQCISCTQRTVLQPWVSPAVHKRWFGVSDTTRRKFVDTVRVQVNGGHGGRGVVSFEELSQGKKRAAGGHGGVGGSVIVEATRSVQSLNFSSFVFNAASGLDASGKGKNGRAGKDVVVHVPCGTVVFEVHKDVVSAPPTLMEAGELVDPDDDFVWDGDEWAAAFGPTLYEEEREAIADLDSPGDRIIVAKGGAPGQGNMSMPRWHRKPNTPHIAGEPGEHRLLEFELKTIADVGLVGFPNAGKSTLLGSISRSRPKTASYPFTTLHPSVGMLNFADGFRLTVADIPGLIDGAHEDKGLGHDFLRHIERTRVLLYVIDVSNWCGRDPVEQLTALQAELEMYDPELMLRAAAVVANKIDLEGAEENIAKLRAHTLMPVLGVSALKGRDVEHLVNGVRWLVESVAPKQQKNT